MAAPQFRADLALCPAKESTGRLIYACSKRGKQLLPT
jgi:hypothetical protein